MSLEPLERIMSRRTVEDSGCWVFNGARRNGYGAIGIDHSTVYVHRYTYERLVGPIPPGLVVDHLCRNRPCFNPDHIELVTRGENVRRGFEHHEPVTECRRGHAYTTENTYVTPEGYKVCRSCRRSRDVAA